MQPIPRQRPTSSSNTQTAARETVRSSYMSRSVSTVPGSPVVYPGNKTRGCTLSDYRICQFTQGAIQLGNSLIRSLAGFAFQQVMDSPEIGLVCPGLKESLVVLLALPTLVSGYPTSICGDGYFTCEGNHGNPCIPENWKCDGFSDCKDKSDEAFCTLITQCEVKDAFLCNNSVKCIPLNKVCDFHNDCGDLSDEPPKVSCYVARPTPTPLTSATPPLTPLTSATPPLTPLTPATSPLTPEASPTTVLTSESSTVGTPSSVFNKYLDAAPFFGMLAGISFASLVTCYCIAAVYQIVKAMRSTNPEASTRQLIQMAIRQPHYFRYPHQPVPIDTRQDDVTPSAPERPEQRPEAQRAIHPQAMHLPAFNQQATELPTYQQATELPTYQQVIELSTYQEATELPAYQETTRRLPTYAEAIAETLV